MATPEQICSAKARACGARPCGFGRPNPNNPSVVFTGCPACKNESRAGVTEDEAEREMAAFMRRIGG